MLLFFDYSVILVFGGFGSIRSIVKVVSDLLEIKYI